MEPPKKTFHSAQQITPPAQAPPRRDSFEINPLKETICDAGNAEKKLSERDKEIRTDKWVTERMFRIGRMATDNFDTMADYVENLIREFQDIRRCTVYQVPSDIFTNDAALTMEHRVTVRFEGGKITKDEKGGRYTPAPDDDILSVFMSKCPTIYDFNPDGGLDTGIKLVFTDLNRNSDDRRDSLIPRDMGNDMVAIMPYYYREPGYVSGVVVFKGDLRGKDSTLEGYSRTYWAAKLAMNASAQISAALTHRYDAITKLPKRKDFEVGLREGIRNLINEDINGLYLMFMDIDDFKKINDVYTHPIGDEVIRKVAERIESCIRSMDMAFRLGGEEFGVILSGVSYLTATNIAERIRHSIESMEIWVKRESDGTVRMLDGPDPQGELLTVRISMGLADVRQEAGAVIGRNLPNSSTSEGIIQDIYSSAYHRSAELLHRAKKDGKNCIFFADESGSTGRLTI